MTLAFIIVLVALLGALAVAVFAAYQQRTRPMPGGAELLLGPVLAAAPDAMVVAGRDGRIELVNAAAERLFGYAPGRMMGAKVADLIPRRFQASHELHYSGWFDDPKERNFGPELRLFGRRRDGTEFRCSIGLAPLPIDRVIAVIREEHGVFTLPDKVE